MTAADRTLATAAGRALAYDRRNNCLRWHTANCTCWRPPESVPPMTSLPPLVPQSRQAAVPPPPPPPEAPARCTACGYLAGSVGHTVECGDDDA